VSLLVDAQELSVRRHDIRGEQVVDREAVPPDEVPDAAPERDPADPDGPGVPETRGELVLGRCHRILAGGETRLGPSSPALHVDIERLHRREIQDDASVRAAVSGAAVAAASDRQLTAGLGGEPHDAGDLLGVDRPDDGRRTLVEVPGEQLPRGVVAGVARPDHLAGEVVAERGDRNGFRGCHRFLLRSTHLHDEPAIRRATSLNRRFLLS
jgi:hypothetical protein